ncbi:DUF1622 domain-containing protein [Chryseobacterium balustinum]|uniref:Protein of uncharacterized function (DUF1622) n=1 Tax=Chryseobacterium balustinum TaxID=246 RepID=A0AAX2IQ87_9FLAO|nr:DUF1622 domain-containing protein [Chryseobacterium balustinum]AZB30094.1 DUF1622 domain-containing protein [Chryseobacterium balustinum]SKB66129.1 Uncharacterized membrane protein [Chryseobacterium balustinum]SQA91801.1 Protein of uncharacterised function (DUF1622) [Chryseobacterium balustinum]
MEEVKIYIDYVARIIEVIGVLTIFAGAVIALVKYIFSIQSANPRSYKILKQELGKAILLGLEILVAGDIIATVVTEPTIDRLLALGLIVLIRTFLSISIQVEVEGKFPWQKKEEI